MKKQVASIGRVEEIKKLHKEIESTMKMTVEKAIRIGELLAEQKSEMAHGEFLPWLEENIEFSERTARNYMRLYRYREKITDVSDFGEAYRRVELLDYKENGNPSKEDRKMIRIFKKTGNKPEGWEAKNEIHYRETLDDNEFETQIDESVGKYKKEKEKRRKELEQRHMDDERKTLEWLEKIELIIERVKSHEPIDILEYKTYIEHHDFNFSTDRRKTVRQRVILFIIFEYLNSFDELRLSVETANNIIKYLRDKIIDYQMQEEHMD